MVSLRFAALFALISPLVSAGGHDQTIFVGKDGTLTFYPETMDADPGSTINFKFENGTHTVTQSSFDHPCMKWEGGQASGVRTAPDHFQVHVKDHNPMYFYCGQGDHCSKGMVFSINSKHHHNRFKWKAMNTKPGKSAGPDAGAHWQPREHVVIVGGEKGNVYTPSVVHAEPGEKVRFRFQAKNHTVTQSSFDYPCEKAHGGFASGFRPVQGHGFHPHDFVVDVHSKESIYGYCGQTGHCSQGMVFIINPAPGHGFHAFRDKAKATAWH